MDIRLGAMICPQIADIEGEIERWGHKLTGVREETTDMKDVLRNMWRDDEGQDVAEYALMLAVILVVVIGAVRLIGTNASNIFNAASDQLTTP
jgi:Flp pilus assembly pilin Flp